MISQSIIIVDNVVEELLNTWQLGIREETDKDESTIYPPLICSQFLKMRLTSSS